MCSLLSETLSLKLENVLTYLVAGWGRSINQKRGYQNLRKRG